MANSHEGLADDGGGNYGGSCWRALMLWEADDDRWHAADLAAIAAVMDRPTAIQDEWKPKTVQARRPKGERAPEPDETPAHDNGEDDGMDLRAVREAALRTLGTPDPTPLH